MSSRRLYICVAQTRFSVKCNPNPLKLKLWSRLPSPACVCCVQRLADNRAPLQHKEQQASAELPGVSDWQAVAAEFPPPETYAWDVFISHAGAAADKPFARALYKLLERTGWGLRIFLDEESLQPAGDAQRAIQAALQSTAVAVLLFSAETFERVATGAELRALVAQHALRRVRLLPVFLRMRVEDCKRSLANILGQGASAPLASALQWYAMQPCSTAMNIGHVQVLCSARGRCRLAEPCRMRSGCNKWFLCRKHGLAHRHPPLGRGQHPAARHRQDRA